jgi:peptide/nickel transport system substrate-binding protein
MLSRRKPFALFSAAIILAVVFSACGGAATPQVQVAEVTKLVKETVVEKVVETVEVQVTAPPEVSQPTGTLKVAVSTQPNTLDTPISAEQQSRNTSQGMFDSLLWVNDQGELEPALAESWEVSEDGLEYTFHLRKDVTFHNGEPFNADSVVFSWQRYISPDLEWSERWTMADNVEKVDDYTVKITTNEPKPLLLRTIAIHWAMIPPKYFEEVGEVEFGQNPVGTGPFMFVEWVQGDHVTLKANPNYWREGYPKVAEVIFRPIPESATRVAAIQTGEVDIVGRLSSEEAQSLLGVEGVQVIRYPVSRVYYIAFNNMSTGVGQPTEDPLVRQAMNHAVDVQAIIDALFDGYAKRATGFVATGEMGYGTVEPFEYDPDKARALLAEAGYPNGFTMGFACPAGAYTHFEEVCEAIQGYLSEVGIETELEIMESAHFWDLEGKQELPPLFGDSWSERSGEAYNRMAGALLAQGFSSWKDDQIIDLLGQIASSVDDETRQGLYEDLQVYMKDNPPFIYLYEPMAFEAIRDHVQDYKPRSAEEYYLFPTWVVGE